ncbi:MAG TPA: FprA family A-type flavoprotein [Myxococcota bacterium]|nr:FprA family A-type flavoprotein [Myxococcota bacterium]HRY93217.1 FprA family A-type flavoprotein [Myxococcota bacterium]HSA21008.1 FprA family A-type flavoprotein [Myxococcota bacterium]
MESAVKLVDGVHWVGANDRETDLFENMWPLPKGVAYNSYLVQGRKTALIDTIKTVSGPPFLAKVRELLGGRKLDYLVVNHVEPDHSGILNVVRQVFPGVELVGNKKTAEFLLHLHKVTDGIRVVADGETLDLGGHRLTFHLAPMVHWPETMVTFEHEHGVLFSCDAFGAFGALDGGLFDDEIDVDEAESEMLRYYSNIVGRYSVMVQKALAKLAGLPVEIIAPSHGPVWRKDPAKVIERYRRWSHWEAERGVVLCYGSMYGNVRKMMEAVAEGLVAGGERRLVVHDVSRAHLSTMVRDAWRYQAVLLGAPAYDTLLYPPMAHLVDLFERKGLKNRLLGIFGSYGWSGGGVSALKEFAGRCAWELVEPVVEARFQPAEEALAACRELGSHVAARLRAQAEPGKT